MFKKDGEKKVFKPKDDLSHKKGEQEESERYTVDDLVKDSDRKETTETK